jgi:peroxiredoxin
MPSLEEKVNDFAAVDTQILGMSVDSTWCLDAWADHLGLTYPLVSDIMHTAGKAYGVFNAERHIDARAVFLIDKAGVVRLKEVYEPGTLPDPAALLEAARAL